MIAEAINKIVGMAQVETLTVLGRKFTSRQVSEIEPVVITPLTVHTLQSVVDFFDGDIEVNKDIEPADVLIHVVDPYTVSVRGGVADDIYRNREHFLTAKRIHKEFRFDTYFEQEEMVMSLMTLFEDTPTLQDVIKAVSGLVVSQEAKVSDDGVSQDIQVRKGVGRIEKLTIKNPILLTPIRTFTEVQQVESPYVLRIRESRSGAPEIAIFEAGGDQWKNDAIQHIKRWLSERIEGAKILG